MLRNLGGIGDAKLFEHCLAGTKSLIGEYIQEVVQQLDAICETDFPDFSPEKKFDLFYELKQSYGRSALLLSGGVTFGRNSFAQVTKRKHPSNVSCWSDPVPVGAKAIAQSHLRL